MCYMKTSGRRVGVRELRQNLSVYLRRVEAGHTLEVTERGRPVALLVPNPGATTPLGRLVSSGRATMPTGDLLDLGPPPKRRGRSLSSALAELREERV
jgi:prevent-host-death family protein